jgi:hypothetical protein
MSHASYRQLTPHCFTDDDTSTLSKTPDTLDELFILVNLSVIAKRMGDIFAANYEYRAEVDAN